MKANSSASAIADDLQALADEASEIARRTLVEPTQEKAHEVATTMRKQARRGQKALRRDRRRVEKRVRRHPLEAVAIAFGAGLLSGVILGKLS